MLSWKDIKLEWRKYLALVQRDNKGNNLAWSQNELYALLFSSSSSFQLFQSEVGSGPNWISQLTDRGSGHPRCLISVRGGHLLDSASCSSPGPRETLASTWGCRSKRGSFVVTCPLFHSNRKPSGLPSTNPNFLPSYLTCLSSSVQPLRSFFWSNAISFSSHHQQNG